jgi:hypothetical protein
MVEPSRFHTDPVSGHYEVKGAVPGKAYRVFSDEELQALTEGVQWLRAAEPAFEFWNNDDDAIYDQL